MLCFQFYRVDIHHDLAIASAKWLRDGCTWNIGDLVADLELREILEIGLIQPLPLRVTRHTG